MVVTPRAGRFGSMLTAMVTPFDAEGRLDLDGAVTLARQLIADGNDGLVIAGTTGEAPALTDAETVELWRAVSAGVTAPVIAGTGTNDTAHSIELTKAAADAGAAGVLVVTPYYSRPPQSGLAAHFRAVAAASRLPVLLYDIPVRTGRKISHDLLVELATEVPNIVGVKDAAGDPAAAARLVAAVPPGFDLYSGDDVLTLPLLAIGAVGVISVAGNWAAGEIAESIRSFLAGDIERAREVNAALLGSYSFETGEEAPNPLPAKAMLRVLGRPGGGCRLPLGEFPPGLEDRAKRVLADLDAWRQADAAPAPGR